MELICYSQRLLNPFRGVMNIIEYQGAQAVSTDGVHWDIYVRDNELVSDLANSHKVQTSDIRYGSWSEDKGLKRGALYPSDDFKYLENLGAIVYEFLLKHHHEVPFPFKDYYELWLLDKQTQPLALLNSVIRKEDMDFDIPLSWRSGIACRKSFQTTVCQELCSNDIHPADYINHYINSFAHDEPSAQWFHRDSNGKVTGMDGINLKHALINRSLNDIQFPAFYITEKGHDPLHTQLIDEFLAWQAPHSLLLQHLDDKTRSMLEQQAGQRALILNENYHLYPQIINQKIFNAARVEALLRKNHRVPEETEEVMSAEYIELNISRTN